MLGNSKENFERLQKKTIVVGACKMRSKCQMKLGIEARVNNAVTDYVRNSGLYS